MVGRRTGTALVPLINGKRGPSAELETKLDPRGPPGPSGGCNDGSSAAMEMIRGTCPGATILGTTVLRATVGAVVRGEAASGIRERRPRVIGVETVRADGRPTVLNTGSRSRSPRASTCNPNEVSVVQLRRVRWAQEVSSMLSAKSEFNAALSTIVSSSM